MSEVRAETLQTSWLGTAGVSIAYKHATLLIDGFFSRPSLSQVAFTRLKPDLRRIAAGLSRSGIARLDAFLAGHAHYDHALDAATIARQTGAKCFGSASFANIVRGAGIPQELVQSVEPGQRTSIGPFQVEWIESRHNQPDLAPGNITAQLPTPAHASAFRAGTTFALRIHTPAGILGVLGSAGFLPGMFHDRPIDALFLSIAGLSRSGPAACENFFTEVIVESKAKIVYPIHWDHFFRPASALPLCLPRIFDDVHATHSCLEKFCQAHSILFQLPPFFQAFNPISDVK